MQNTKTKVITILLLSALTLAIFPFAVNASTGFITINTTGASTPGQNVQAGGNVSLYFGSVTFSGGQFNLYIGPQGFSQITSTGPNADTQYTPTFNLADLQAAAVTQVPGTTQFPGGWTIGFNWVNGTIKQDVAGGNFFIKAFDGTSTSVAVTDTFITIIANVFVAPTSGTAGQSITISGFAFPANALVNITYSSLSLGAARILATLVPTGILGNFSFVTPAPDTKLQLAAGQNAIANETITFNVIENRTGATYAATYTEFARGLVSIAVTGTGGASQVAAAGTLFGNNTVFTLTGVGVTKVLRIVGNYFYPGALVTQFDNAALTNSAPTVNGTGWFNTTVTVPPATNGQHNITLTDGNGTLFALYVTVVPSLALSPTSGPVGTTVTATGYGFTAPTTGVAVNASLAWPGVAAYVGSAFVDASGTFTTTFVVPNAVGGANNVTAAQNATGSFVVIAFASFTVTTSFTVTPASFVNNASRLVTATGTGFKAGFIYMPNIDNQMLGFDPIYLLGSPYNTGISPDSNGRISITFIGAGFQPGTHVFSLYENGTATPSAYAGFNVTGDPVASTIDLLNSINNTVTSINGNMSVLLAIQGDVAIIKTSVGTISTSVTNLQSAVTSIQGSIAQISTPNLGPITASLASISAKLDTVSGDTATVKTSVGTITTSLADITAGVTGIHGDTAEIKTSLGTLTGTITSISGDIATIKTSIGTMQADISGLKTSMGTVQTDVASSKSASESLSPLIIVAIVLALIAAIAAIASIVLMRRKIAG